VVGRSLQRLQRTPPPKGTSLGVPFLQMRIDINYPIDTLPVHHIRDLPHFRVLIGALFGKYDSCDRKMGHNQVTLCVDVKPVTICRERLGDIAAHIKHRCHGSLAPVCRQADFLCRESP
jgi:hypothetical protein